MGCKKTTIRIGKFIAKAATPALVKFIGTTVGILNQMPEMTNDEKREFSVSMAMRRAAKDGLQEAKESVIRAVVEVAVVALKQGEDKLADLGTMEIREVESVVEG